MSVTGTRRRASHAHRRFHPGRDHRHLDGARVFWPRCWSASVPGKASAWTRRCFKPASCSWLIIWSTGNSRAWIRSRKARGTRRSLPMDRCPPRSGKIMIGISSDAQFRRLCAALGHEEWAADPRFRTNTDRVANVDELENLIGDVLRTQPTPHWVALFDQCDIANDAIQSPSQVLRRSAGRRVGSIHSDQLDG